MKQRWLFGITALCALFLTGCSESIVNAGYNTILGMGMAFSVLILISLVISLFPLIGKIQEGKKPDEKKRLAAIDKTLGQIAENESVAAKKSTAAPVQNNDDELVAVIAAAIAAFEEDTGRTYSSYTYGSDMYVDDYDPDRDYGTYRARPIRRARRASAWKKA